MRNHVTNPSVSRHRASLWAGMALALSLPAFGAGGTPAKAVDGQQIASLAEHALLVRLRRHPAAQDARRIEVGVGALDSRLAFTPCAEPIQVSADLSRLQTRVNARVSCAAPSPWALYVPAELRIIKPVSVAARDLQRGEILGEADIAEHEHNILAGDAASAVRRMDLPGQVVRRTILAGSVLSASLLEQPLQVRRGDRIDVESGSGGISVRITAEAMGSARRGEKLRVRNLQSGRTIDVIVTGAGTARTL